MLEFLEAIWDRQTPEGKYAEYRLIANDGKVDRGYWAIEDRDQLIAQMAEQDDPEKWPQRFNIFVGVLLRTRRAGTADAVVSRTPVLWADFDTKNFKSRMDTFYAVQQMSIPPQIMIDSGHGFHTYWLLDGYMEVKLAQRVMNGMANKYGSDKVGDPARVMRVPGTHNVKDENDPRLVRMIKFDPLERSRPGDFFTYLEEESKPVAWWYKPEVQRVVGVKDVEDRLRTPAPRGQRSEYIFGIVCDLVRNGQSLGQVYDTLVESAAGDKIREMDENHAIRWVQRTYESAMKAVRLDK